MSGVEHPSPWGPRVWLPPSAHSLPWGHPCSPGIQSPGPLQLPTSEEVVHRAKHKLRNEKPDFSFTSTPPRPPRMLLGSPSMPRLRSWLQSKGAVPPHALLSKMPKFQNSRILLFISPPLFFPGEPLPHRTYMCNSSPPQYLLPPQDHPRDSLTYCGGQGPSSRVAVRPEAAAKSPLLLLTPLTPPFCFHG